MAAVGRCAFDPTGISKLCVPLILTTPVPLGVNSMLPLALVAVIEFPAILKLPVITSAELIIVVLNMS